MRLAVFIHCTGVTNSNGDWDKDIAIVMGGIGERGRLTVRTRINTDLDIADASKLDFFYRLFTPEMFCYNSSANKTVCSRNDCSSTKPALQEVNKRPRCAQQRVN